MPFRVFGLDANILKAVQEAGYTEPMPIQSAAIPQILAGHDLIGIAQTGTGKTAAFVLPILTKIAGRSTNDGRPGPRELHEPELVDVCGKTASSPQPLPPDAQRERPPRVAGFIAPGRIQQSVKVLPAYAPLRRGEGPRSIRALIVAPTRELVVQIEENVRIYGKYLPLRAATIYGGVSERPQIEALCAGVDLLVATPGRLLDLMGRRLCDFSKLRFLVLDEAERMLDMGFLPDIRRIVRTLPPKRQTLLFSATLSREIESVTHEFLRAPKTIQIGRRANPADTVTQLVYEVPKHLKSALLVHLLREPSLNMVLIFSRMKHGADRIARCLESHGIRTATLHSNRSQNQRLRALRDFKSGAVRVLVATDIAARGIDVDGISHVVNYDFPMHPEDYVHRIGRTGRAHAVGDAISFVTPEEQGALRSLERFIGRGIVRKRAEGFNYGATVSNGVPRDRTERPFIPSRTRQQPVVGRSNGGGFGRRNGSGAVVPGRNNRWRR